MEGTTMKQKRANSKIKMHAWTPFKTKTLPFAAILLSLFIGPVHAMAESVPPSPTNIKAVSVSAARIDLSWKDNSVETGFKVYRKAGAAPWTLIAITAANAVGYRDNTALNNLSSMPYRYYVCSYNDAGSSQIPNLAIVPFRPTNLRAVPGTKDRSINLTWQDHSNNESGFEIFRKAGPCSSKSVWGRVAVVAVNKTSWTDTGLIAGHTYSYRIRAYKKTGITLPSYGYSMWSNCIPVTVGTANITGGYAYVANQYANTISQYTIGVDGVLTPMSPAAVMTGDVPESITVDPSGKYAYVANAKPTPAGRIFQYTIEADGALSPMSTPWVSAGTYPVSIAVDPSGRYAYVANNLTGNISQYTVGSDGALTPMNPATVMSGSGYPNAPSCIVVDPAGKHVYVANADGKSISQYTIGATGMISPMTPAMVATSGVNGNAHHMAVHPSGNFLYVAGYFDNVIFQYTVGVNGALSLMSPATAATGPYPGAVVVDSLGNYAYVVSASMPSAAISQYTIGATGALTPMVPATIAATTGFANAALGPSGKYVYATSGYPGSTVSQFSIGANGALSPMTPATVPSGSGPNSIVTVMK
jgi:6-phosphogluconolactonase